MKFVKYIFTIVAIVAILFFVFNSKKDNSKLDENRLVIGNAAEPKTLDPTKFNGLPGRDIDRNLFEPLMTLNVKGETILGAAKSYKVSNDGKVYTFIIRDDAMWSNNSPLTSHDFVFAFRRSVDSKSSTNGKNKWFFKILGIKNVDKVYKGELPLNELGVKAINDKTLQIILKKPIPYFIIALAHIITAPIPKDIVKKFGDNWIKPENMVTNGPYTLKEWVVNEKIVLQKSLTYYDKDNVSIKEVEFLPLSDKAAELNRYRAGEIDMTSMGIIADQFQALKKEFKDQIKILGQVGTYYYGFNLRQERFKNLALRQALTYAVNRDEITNQTLGTGEIPIYSITPNTVANFKQKLPSYALLTQKERDEKARQLFKELGYTKDNPLKFKLLYNTNSNHKRVALSVVSRWKKVFGDAISVQLENREWKVFLTDRMSGNFDITREGWIGDYNDASTMLDILTLNHNSNHVKYASSEFNALMNKARLTLDDKKRNDLYQKADLIIAKDLPIIPIYQYVTNRFVSPRVGGYPSSNPLGRIGVKYLYIKK